MEEVLEYHIDQFMFQDFLSHKFIFVLAFQKIVLARSMPYGLFLHLANFHLLIHSKYEFDLISHANEHTYIHVIEKQVYFTVSVHFDFKLRNLNQSSISWTGVFFKLMKLTYFSWSSEHGF